jgi:DNA polymerase-3 subunit beta
MKIQCSKENLLKGVQTVQNIITSRTILPILSNILIEAKKDKLRVVSTDLDIGIYSFIPVEVLEEGVITLPAKKFGDIVKELPDNIITIYVKKNNVVIIECENCFFKLMGLAPDEFPKLPEFKDKEILVISQNILKDMLRLTSFAVSYDETRYILNGILFVIKDNTLRLVATDGRRLALIEKELNLPKGIHKEIIVPIKTIQELNRNLTDEGDLKLIFGDNQILFEMGDTTLISRLTEGEFPNYEQVIPQESKQKLKINKERLLLAIRRASLFTTPDSQSIKIELFKNKMVVSKSAPDLGESREEIEIDHKGQELSIGFNPNYLIDVLKNVSQEEIELELVAPDKPGVIRLDNYIYIILPMQIS